MRASQKSSRARGRGGRKPNGNNINRVYESAGPEGKVRGTPQQIIDKYLGLARDAQTSGDRVISENFLQHAEHYQRILIESMGARQDRREGQPGDPDQSDFDMADDVDSAEMQVIAPMVPSRHGNGPRRDDGRRNDRDNGQGASGDDGSDDPRAVPEPEVSGLTTIDSGGGDAGSLLVDAEDLSASQPRRRRNRPGQGSPAAEAREAPAPGDVESQSD